MKETPVKSSARIIHRRHRRLATRLAFLAALASLSAGPSTTLAINWDGSEAVKNWSTGLNWVGDVAPTAAQSADFAATGGAGAAATVTNIVDAAFGGTVTSMTFTNTTGNFHNTRLDRSLTLNGNLTVNQGVNTTTHQTFSTASGQTLTVGSLATRRDIFVGRRTDSNTGAYRGILDLSNIDFSATLNNFLIGTTTTGDNAEVAVGEVFLGASNTIRATTFTVGDSSASGQTGAANTSKLHFGASNTLNVNTFTVGRQKTDATADIVVGGVLSLAGDTVAGADLLVGANLASATGTTTVAVMDLSNGTFNATLDEVILGRHHSGGGSGRGTLIMSAGNVTAASMLLADPDFGGATTTDANTQGTFTLNGGSFRVTGNVTDGGGTSFINLAGGHFIVSGSIGIGGSGVDTFNWTGGKFGAGTVNGNLTQNDADTTLAAGLSPGIMNINGNYSLLAGDLEIEFQAPGVTPGVDFDFYNITGTANLNSIVSLVGLASFVAPIGSFYDVLTATSITLGSNFALDSSAFASGGYATASIISGGNGQILRISIVVPEPATMSLLALGSVALLRRRASGRAAL